MRLVDYLDKGASLGPGAPCLTTDGETRTYVEVQADSHRVADALARHGVAPGQSVAILSANDPTSCTCVFGISRAGAVWCPINPRNEASENRELLDRVLETQIGSALPITAPTHPDRPSLAARLSRSSDRVVASGTRSTPASNARKLSPPSASDRLAVTE